MHKRWVMTAALAVGLGASAGCAKKAANGTGEGTGASVVAGSFQQAVRDSAAVAGDSDLESFMLSLEYPVMPGVVLASCGAAGFDKTEIDRGCVYSN